MTVNYSTHRELGEGARKFVFFNNKSNIRIHFVQIVMFKNMTPSPVLKFYLDSGEKTNTEILQHIKNILEKTEETLQVEEETKMHKSNPPNFGPRKYHLRECMCEVEG
ncbi:small ribosomal subunit protein mS25-like [Pelobates fuscus]|uniref:small ribosomal subunit protein mS25-like n=1 Tax=Pelobates fuscus TaxID=191477 RepID=UPI002FE44070